MKQLLSLLFSACLAGAYAQGPISGFMNGDGVTDIAISYATESYDEYRFGDETRDQAQTIDSYNLFLEHNFNDSFAIVATLPYLRADGENEGLQDAIIAIKYLNRYRERDRSSVTHLTSVGLSFPSSNYPTETMGAIGQQGISFRGRYSIQQNYYNGFFWNLKAGLDFQVSPQALTAIPALLRLGYGNAKIFVEGWFEVYTTLQSVEQDQAIAGAGSNWQRVGATVYVPVVGGLGLAANTAFILGGRNIGLSERHGLAIVYRFR